MYRFIHIGLMFPGIPKVNDLEPVFHAMGDEWIRYSQCCWIMWTDKSLVDVYDRLHPYLNDDDQILIAPIDMSQCLGSLSPWVWDWIQRHCEDQVYTGKSLDEMIDRLLPPPTRSGATW